MSNSLDIMNDYNAIPSTEEVAVEIGQRLKGVRERMKETIEKSKFPIEALPPVLQEFIKGYMDVYDVPADHYGLAFLTVGGAAIGNAAVIDDRGTVHPPVIYAAVVDLPGSGKTPTINTVLKPLVKREQELQRQYEFKLRQAAEETMETGKEVSISTPEQILYNDFTLESLIDGLQASPRGILAFHDELDGFLSSMDQYRSGKGGDGAFWTSAYNANAYKANRRNRKRPVFLPRVFCPFLGGIQPGLLDQFSNDNRDSSGFLARILFSIPGRSLKQPYHNARPDPGHAERWESMIHRIFEVKPIQHEAAGDFNDAREEPNVIQLSSDAQSIYAVFYNSLAEKVNETDNTTERSTLIKFETHVLRIALILHFLDWSGESANQKSVWLQPAYIGADSIVDREISGSCMQRAIRIARYFMATGLEVVGLLSGPHKSLPPHQMIWYEGLSEEPTSEEALALAEACKDPKGQVMSNRTINRLLGRKDLFKRQRKGVYLKLHL